MVLDLLVLDVVVLDVVVVADLGEPGMVQHLVELDVVERHVLELDLVVVEKGYGKARLAMLSFGDACCCVIVACCSGRPRPPRPGGGR